jgi:hypothetical protein
MDNRLQQVGNNGYIHDEKGFRSIWNSGGKYTLYEYVLDYRLLKLEKSDDRVVLKCTHDDNCQRECKYRNGVMVEDYKWFDFLRLAGFHDGEIGYRFAYNGEERTPYVMSLYFVKSTLGPDEPYLVGGGKTERRSTTFQGYAPSKLKEGLQVVVLMAV